MLRPSYRSGTSRLTGDRLIRLAASGYNCSNQTTETDTIMNRVVITGMGWITPMGHSIDGVWKRLLAGESGIARTTLFDAATFPTTHLAPR